MVVTTLYLLERKCSYQQGSCDWPTADIFRLEVQDLDQPVAVTSRRRLRSTSSSVLVVPATRPTTIGYTELLPSPTPDLVHGTVFLNSSLTAHLLASQDLPIFTIILERTL